MMKTRFLMLLAAMLLGSASAFAQSGNNEPVKGDINGDGIVDVADITAIIGIIKDNDGTDPDPIIPIVELMFETYWNYELSYDLQTEWIYGWDEIDDEILGRISYTVPTGFNVRRYYTSDVPNGPHTNVLQDMVKGTTMRSVFDFGYWDILAWNFVETSEGVQSLCFNETLDGVTAYTNQVYHYAPWASGSARSFYQPEQLFSGYGQAIGINKNMEGFEYNDEDNVWVKRLYMVLEPITYTYLTQVILHNNNNKIISVDGSADISGMARTTNVNTGVAGDEPVNVMFSTRFKPSVANLRTGETVDVVGGRVMTFGIPNQNCNRISDYSEVKDTQEHYLGINMMFNNGMDSTLVFNVTDQVRRRWKGGVITVELDMDTIPVPNRH